MNEIAILALDERSSWPENDVPPVLALRCTIGRDGSDENYLEWREKAEKLELRVVSIHVVSNEDAVAQIEHFLAISGLEPGQRAFFERHEDADLADVRAVLLNFAMRGGQDQPLVLRCDATMRDVLEDQHDPVLQRADLWILDNGGDEPDFPRKTWATWTLREIPVGGGSVFNGTLEEFQRWLG